MGRGELDVSHIMKITIESITWKSFEDYPVWEWDLGIDDDSTLFPITDYPVSYLEGRIIGIPCQLHNGKSINCILQSVEIGSPHKTEQFLNLYAIIGVRKIRLLRYFDVGASDDPGKDFASEISVNVDEVFPIKWDVQKHVTKGLNGRSGLITRFPTRRLDEQQRMNLLFGQEYG
jgi:hypothetical protein